MRSGDWRSAVEPGPVHALVDRAVAVDGVAPISGHVLDAVRTGQAQVLAAVEAPGTAVAVALAGDPAEVVVDPAIRGRGIGSALVRAAIARQGAVWAYGDLPAARAVAARLDLRPTRVLLQLRRTLPIDAAPIDTAPIDAAPTPPPDGIGIRTFEPGRDEAAFLRVNARAFATHPEQGRLDLAELRDEMAQDWFDPDGFFLAVTDPGDELLGFHWTKVHPHDPDTPGPVGEIYVLGVDPDAGVRGLGGVLAEAGLRHLAGRGLTTVLLYVEQDNERAVRLYRRLGFEVHRTNVVYRPLPAAL